MSLSSGGGSENRTQPLLAFLALGGEWKFESRDSRRSIRVCEDIILGKGYRELELELESILTITFIAVFVLDKITSIHPLYDLYQISPYDLLIQQDKQLMPH